MDLMHLIEVLSVNSQQHDREADLFAHHAETGNDSWECALGQKFHEGAADAYRALAIAVQRMIDHGEPLERALDAALCA